MQIEWQPLPATTASPDALIGAAATLESMAAEAGATGDQVSGILHSGAPDFSAMLGPPIMNRSTEHGVMARSVHRLLTYAASVTRAWAADVAEYIARRNQNLAKRQAFEPMPMAERPIGESTEIMIINREAAHLHAWFQEQAKLRGGQLRDGPTADRLSELGRAQELHGLAARIWDSWQPPPLRVDGADMPALVRRWQNGDATAEEAEAAAQWHADYLQWREQLLANGRSMNSADMDQLDWYEEALTETRLRWVNDLGESPDGRMGIAWGPFQRDDEVSGSYRDENNHWRFLHYDYSVEGFAGLNKDGLSAKIGAEGSTGGFTGRWRGFGLDVLNVNGGANAGAELGAEGLKAKAEASAGGEVIGVDKEFEQNLGPWTIREKVEAGLDVKATASATFENGKADTDIEVDKLKRSPVDVDVNVETDWGKIARWLGVGPERNGSGSF